MCPILLADPEKKNCKVSICSVNVEVIGVLTVWVDGWIKTRLECFAGQIGEEVETALLRHSLFQRAEK